MFSRPDTLRLDAILAQISTRADDSDFENKHKRDKGGKFTSGGGSTSISQEPKGSEASRAPEGGAKPAGGGKIGKTRTAVPAASAAKPAKKTAAAQKFEPAIVREAQKRVTDAAYPNMSRYYQDSKPLGNAERLANAIEEQEQRVRDTARKGVYFEPKVAQYQKKILAYMKSQQFEHQEMGPSPVEAEAAKQAEKAKAKQPPTSAKNQAQKAEKPTAKGELGKLAGKPIGELISARLKGAPKSLHATTEELRWGEGLDRDISKGIAGMSLQDARKVPAEDMERALMHHVGRTSLEHIVRKWSGKSVTQGTSSNTLAEQAAALIKNGETKKPAAVANKKSSGSAGSASAPAPKSVPKKTAAGNPRPTAKSEMAKLAGKPTSDLIRARVAGPPKGMDPTEELHRGQELDRAIGKGVAGMSLEDARKVPAGDMERVLQHHIGTTQLKRIVRKWSGKSMPEGTSGNILAEQAMALVKSGGGTRKKPGSETR